MMKRKSPGEWRPIILAAALDVAQGGLASVTLRGIARRCGISHKQVAISFGSVEDLREAVASEAVRVKDRHVVARMIIDRHPMIAEMPVDERNDYVTLLVR